MLFDDGELIYSLDEHVSIFSILKRASSLRLFFIFILFIMVSIWSATAGEIVGIVRSAVSVYL